MLKFLKNWTLPVSMVLGALAYYIYAAIPTLVATRHFAMQAISVVQPTLLFAMLFLTFCKVKPHDLRFAKWQPIGLALQLGLFIGCATLLYFLQLGHWSVVVESFMICMICPTATAAAVVTQKLGGNAGTLTTYTILINLATAILVPAIVPLIHPEISHSFISAFLIIIAKVFPLLFGPFALAMLLRWINPKITEWFARYTSLAFYLWAVGLALAIAVTAKAIDHSDCPVIYMVAIAGASALSCIIQFAVGRHFGIIFNDRISSAQSLGQKNTVFAIWMSYTFMTPVTALAGGFYSIWHNVYNSWQLYQARKQSAK